jgi:hypothetical protein
MRWRLGGRRAPGDGGDGGNAELDARLSGSWDAAAAAVGKILDVPAGKQVLLASSGLSQDSGLSREETADLRAPAGMPPGTAHRRRLALRSVAGAAAVLAAGAVALVAILVPGSRHHGIDATAYVVKRVSSALSAAEPGEIAQMTVTTRSAALPGGRTTTTTAEEWSSGGRWRLVTYSPTGRPVYDEGFSASSLYTLVSYQSRTWARQHGLRHPAALAMPSGSHGCKPPAAAVPLLFAYGLPGTGSSASSLPSTVARDLRAAVSCGTLAVAGRQRVDGAEAIELTSRPGSLISETIWVSPDTYLPLRVAVRPVPGQPGRWQTADITWLPPTAQNLAKLTVPIPAGFHRVRLTGAVLPILQQVTGGLPGRKPRVLCLGPAGPACQAGTSGPG